jgi:Xaa-Pro aminopeptidase
MQALRSALRPIDVDVIVISHPVNIRYLCGFAGSAGVLVVDSAGAALVVDGRYDFIARRGVEDGSLARLDVFTVERRYPRALSEVLTRRGARRVAFEAEHVTVAGLDEWRRAAPDAEWRASEKVVEALRRIKDAGEVATLRRAGRAIIDVAGRLPEWVCAGRAERAIAEDIERGLAEAGFSAPAFPTIVASGPSGVSW